MTYDRYCHVHRDNWFMTRTYGFIRQPEMIAWGEKHLKGYFASMFMSHTGWMLWYFENRFDAIWFKVTWHDGWFEGAL